MIRINLLPWREIERAERQQEFLIVFGAAVLAAVLFLVPIYLVIQSWIGHQKDRNQYLTEQLTMMDDRIKQIKELKSTRDQLIARMMVIQRLQMNRSTIVREYDELVKVLPAGVFYTAIKKKGNHYTIDAIAESNASISQFMRNIEHSELLEKPSIREVNSVDNNGVSRSSFELEMQAKNGEPELPAEVLKVSNKNVPAQVKTGVTAPKPAHAKAPGKK